MPEEIINPEGQESNPNPDGGGEGGTPNVDPNNPDPKQPEGGEGGEGKNDKQTPPADTKPPVRKSKLDFILERKQKKAENLKKQKISELNKKINKDDQESDLEPEDEEIINKTVEKFIRVVAKLV